MTQSKIKVFAGRYVESEKVIPAGSGKVEFGAAIEANEYLREKGYAIGSMDHPNPIPFWYNDGRLPVGVKWHNLTTRDRLHISGVLVSEDFRTKEVVIKFFE